MNCRFQGITVRIKDQRPYKPSALTELLAGNIEVRKNSIAADIGTGCGVLAALASKLGAKKVYAIDVDENCRKPVEANSKANNLDNVIFLKGNMLSPLKEKVDVIIASLPQMPSNRKIGIHRHGSKDGAKFNAELIKKAPKYLRRNGVLFFSLMSISSPIKILKLLEKKFHASIVGAKERKFDKKRFDKLSKGLSDYIFELSKKDKSVLYYRNGKWYYVMYVIKATLK